jgi:hypothetical protein
LVQSAIAILDSKVDPNLAGLFWNDPIKTANVTPDIEKAVKMSPKQENYLVPWIYWLVCNNSDNDLFVYDRSLYYVILEKMLDAGAETDIALSGGGKSSRTAHSLALECVECFRPKDSEEQGLRNRILTKLQKRKTSTRHSRDSKKKGRSWRQVIKRAVTIA